MFEFDAPWAVNPFRAQIECSRLEEDGDPIPVCQMLWPTDLRSEDDTRRFSSLVSAAPELLEALEAILDPASANADKFPRISDIYDFAGKTISKARGAA